MFLLTSIVFVHLLHVESCVYDRRITEFLSSNTVLSETQVSCEKDLSSCDLSCGRRVSRYLDLKRYANFCSLDKNKHKYLSQFMTIVNI